MSRESVRDSRVLPSRRTTGVGGTENGTAMILALAVLMIVTMMVGILEQTMQRDLEVSQHSAAKVQADYACYGGAVRAAVQKPDQVTQYKYYGTEVEVTDFVPPLSLLQIMMDRNEAPTGDIRLLRSEATSPTEDSTAESTWYYFVSEKDRPVFWTSWPGIARSQPYMSKDE